MIVHFICRGNAFRSIIAEAYLNSLGVADVTVLSSGTVADAHRARNLPHYEQTLALLARHGLRDFAKPGYGDQLTQQRLAHADIPVCMNQRVYDDGRQLVTFPASVRIWSVADVGEPGRVSADSSEHDRFRAEALAEIVRHVDQLVADLPTRR